VNGEREPRLQPDVHESPLGVDHVVVIMQALARRAAQLEISPAAIPSDLEGTAKLDAAQHANESLSNAVFGGDFAGHLLFTGRRAGEIPHGSSARPLQH